MADKRMLIINAEVARKIDENRGEIGRAEFIDFLIDSHLEEAMPEHKNYVEKEEFEQFAQGMKELLRNFLEFFLSYGMELGEQPQDGAFEELRQKLQELGSRARKSKAST